LRTDRFWERQFAFDEKCTLSNSVANVIKRYDGIGWYTTPISVPAGWKGRKIFLRFGAVDESCWIWLNGRKAGEHLFKHSKDWKTPFEIRIDNLIEWEKEKQTVMVRVEDKSGVGGIWRPVWLVSKK
jgi:beta-galactosidase/beta-glucuronidase